MIALDENLTMTVVMPVELWLLVGHSSNGRGAVMTPIFKKATIEGGEVESLAGGEFVHNKGQRISAYLSDEWTPWPELGSARRKKQEFRDWMRDQKTQGRLS